MKTASGFRILFHFTIPHSEFRIPNSIMSEKATILLHLDTDLLPSVFDRVVAVDSGVSHIFSYGGVTPGNVVSLVHGCIFTRGPKDLHRTAIFIGGSGVAAGCRDCGWIIRCRPRRESFASSLSSRR